MQSSALVLMVAAAMSAGCGDDGTPRGEGGAGTTASGPATTTGSGTGSGGEAATTAASGTGGDPSGAGGAGGAGGSGVAIVDEALDGSCPPGGAEPGNGVTPGTDLHKVTLDDFPEAVCNDGSPAIMYVRAASTAATEGRWVIHHQAGGGCSDYEECMRRWCGIGAYDASRMSSRFTPDGAEGRGVLLRAERNAFGSANQVLLYYCSSDTWLGRKSDTVLDDPDGELPSFRLHFRGHSILQAVAAALAEGVTSDDGEVTLPPLADAEQVLLTGSSAGSIGIMTALDWWKDRLPAGAQVGGVTDSWLLPDIEDVDDAEVRASYDAGLRGRWDERLVPLYDSYADESCLEAHGGTDEEYLCGFPTHVVLNHLTTPFFVRQDLTDPGNFGSLQAAGASLAQHATWVHQTVLRLDVRATEGEEDVPFTPGRHVTNCGQHIVLLNNGWFGTAPEGSNATVETSDAAPITLHDAIVGWASGTEIDAVDTHPSTVSECIATTDDG